MRIKMLHSIIIMNFIDTYLKRGISRINNNKLTKNLKNKSFEVAGNAPHLWREGQFLDWISEKWLNKTIINKYKKRQKLN